MKKVIMMAIAAMIALPSATMAQKTTIQRVTREKTYTTQTHSVSVWYQGEVSVGLATGGKLVYKDGSTTEKMKTDFSRPFIETVHGVRITKYGFVGVGLGAQYAYGKFMPDYEDSPNWGTLLMPLFVNLKGYCPVSDDFAPYLTVSLGASPVLTSNFNESDEGYEDKLLGGFYCKFGVGFNYKKLLFDFGLMHQNLSEKVTYRGESEKENLGGINSVYFNVGIKF